MHSLAAVRRPRLSETIRSCSCSKLPAMRFVGDIALNPSLRQINVNTVVQVVPFDVYCDYKILLTMR